MAGAPTHTLLTRGSSSTDATSYAATSVTPTSGRILLAYCATQIGAGTPNTPTASGTNGFSGTWTEIANAVQDQTKITLFRSTAASSVAGVLTFDFAGQTQIGACWQVLQWQNVASTINVQSRTAVANGATSLSFGSPLSAFASPFNTTYVCAAASGSFITVRATDAVGVLAQVPQAASAIGEIGACDWVSSGAVLAPALACSGAGSDLVAVAIEVAHDGSFAIPTGAYSLSGTVTSGGSPVSGATVRVVDRTRGYVSTATTNGSGAWSVSVDVNTADRFAAFAEYENGGTKYQALAPWALTAA